MTTQTEAQRLSNEWFQRITLRQRVELGGKMASELRSLETANAELLEALRHIHGVALANEWRDLPGIAQTAGEAVKKHESAA